MLIAVSNDMISSETTDHNNTDCEILWVTISLVGAKALHIGAFYRPPDSDLDYLQNLESSLGRLTQSGAKDIWLGGDFNAPHVDWSSLEMAPAAGGKRALYQHLVDITMDHNLDQVLDKPTRGDNILDLLLTNN